MGEISTWRLYLSHSPYLFWKAELYKALETKVVLSRSNTNLLKWMLMKTEPTVISDESLKKQPVNQPASHYWEISLIKLTFYVTVLVGFCWLLSCVITKEVVIGLLIGFILISRIMKFAFSVILTIVKWIVIAVILLLMICFL